MFENNTPVLFIIFNRFDTAQRVFECIRLAKPPRLYVSSDGYRDGKEKEKETVNKLRNYIKESVDWDCEVFTLFNNTNLGCKKAVTNAIDWFFENEEQGIILEDDCLPSESFFKFCGENLNKYKFDTRISGICGSNFNSSLNDSQVNSYFFSEILYMWGWATWKRAWEINKIFNESFNALVEDSQINNVCYNKVANKMWVQESRKAINGEIDTWDYQWLFANICDGKSAIIPRENLILNIGFDTNATHTKHVRKELVVNSQQIDFPIIHPKIFVRNLQYDSFFYKNIYGWNSFLGRVQLKLRKIFKMQ